MTAPIDWSSIVNTVIGAALAIGGGLTGAVWTERRATAREERERKHEHDAWTRDVRREAHVRFLAEFQAKYQSVLKMQRDAVSIPDGYLVPLWELYASLRLFVEARTAKAAEEAVGELRCLAYEDGRWEQVEWQLDRYIAAARAEFRLGEIPGTFDDGQ